MLAPDAAAQTITKLSVGPSGEHGNATCGFSFGTDPISADGRFVVFASDASNLVPGDTNGKRDVFLHDRIAGTTVRVSVGNGGAQADQDCLAGSVSDDGRYVAFQSSASSLAPGGTPGFPDVFRRDLLTGTLERVGLSISGAPPDGSCQRPSISADGSRIAFDSGATNLVAGDTNNRRDIFVRDLPSGTTWLVSRHPAGALSDGDSDTPALSGNGKFVAFNCNARNFGTPSWTHQPRVQLASVPSGWVEEVSVSSTGAAADADAFTPSISGDGSRIVFRSCAGNLAPCAPNEISAFLRDRTSGTTQVVTRLPDGSLLKSRTIDVRISNNGKYLTVCTNAFAAGGATPHTSLQAWLLDVETWQATRLSVPCPAGAPQDFGVRCISGASDDGLWSTLLTEARALVPGEPLDWHTDVYLAHSLSRWHRDADGDGFGAATLQFTTRPGVPPPPGHVTDARDCDDSRADVRPDAIDICNGIDEDCDGELFPGAVTTYCPLVTSFAGCVATMSSSGVPSAALPDGFTLSASSLPGARQACLVYGLFATQVSFALGSSSSICVGAPRVRTAITPTGGTAAACDGTFSLDWLAWMRAHPTALGNPLQIGQTFHAQVWYRDPGAVLDANLTNALRFNVCP